MPRSFTLEDNDLDPSSVINGHAGHSQKRKEEQDEEEDDDSYEEDEEQASISREEEDKRTTQASKVRNCDSHATLYMIISTTQC